MVRRAVLVLVTMLVPAFAGCLDPIFDSFFGDDECEDAPDGFALHPKSGASNGTSVRVSYACVVGAGAIDEYEWNVTVSRFAPGDPFAWNADAPSVTIAGLLPHSLELESAGGGSFAFWKLDGGNVSTGARGDDGTVSSWTVWFDHWRTHSATPGSERPGISITWDGADAGSEPDPLPRAVYTFDASQRDGERGVTAVCYFRGEPIPGTDRPTGPGCATIVIDRYPVGFDVGE